MRDAVAHPDNYTIQVGKDGQRTSLAAAIAAGIYEIDSNGSLNFANDNSISQEQAQVSNQVNPNRYVTGETAQQLHNLRARMGASVVDAHILQALANSGGDQMSDKARAALSRFASEAGAPNIETARQFVNSVMADVMSSAMVDMSLRHPDIDPEQALEFFHTCDEQVRRQIFAGLYNGSVATLDHWAERFKLGNRS